MTIYSYLEDDFRSDGRLNVSYHTLVKHIIQALHDNEFSPEDQYDALTELVDACAWAGIDKKTCYEWSDKLTGSHLEWPRDAEAVEDDD